MRILHYECFFKDLKFEYSVALMKSVHDRTINYILHVFWIHYEQTKLYTRNQ